MTRDFVLDDPDVTTSPMVNPFANTKKKGKKSGASGKTPKSSGSKKKKIADKGLGANNSEEEAEEGNGDINAIVNSVETE